MRDLIRKSFLLGLGAASLTKAKAEKIVKELAKKGSVGTKEGRQLVNSVLAEANKERKRIQALVQKEANRIAKKTGIASKAQIKRLKGKINELEKRLSKEGEKTAKKIMGKISR